MEAVGSSNQNASFNQSQSDVHQNKLPKKYKNGKSQFFNLVEKIVYEE